LGDQIENDEMGGACGTYGARTGACRVWVRKHDGGRPLGEFRRRWKDNIEMNLQEVE
jgi:predicted Rdx family selenoprotein